MSKKFAVITLSGLLALSALAGMPAAAATNLVANGGFEEPVVDTAQDWDIYVSPVIPGWQVAWVQPGPVQDRPEPALAELHRGVNGWLAYEGEQYAELDSDWDGPAGSLTGEPASIELSQTLATVLGRTYRLTFAFSPRPGTPEADNALGVYWEGGWVDTISRAGNGNTDWSAHTYDLTATVANATLAFRDLGISNSLGTFLDDVAVVDITPAEPRKPISIKVINHKQAFVSNEVVVSADTGGNSANGGNGGAAGDGGDVKYSDDDNVGGAGGHSGPGGAGGTVLTGAATALAELVNEINTDLTEINVPCTVCRPDIRKISVKNHDQAVVFGAVAVQAETGQNEADGGPAEPAGDGGDVKYSDDDNVGGAGGHSGPGGAGGQILSGRSSAYASVINRVNYILTKIQF